jgi:hypothetical protein
MALPKTFTGGERLFAGDLNDNFEALDTRLVTAEFDIDALENASLIVEAAASDAVNLNFSADRLVNRTPAGTITVTGSAYTAGKSVTLRVSNGGTARDISFPAGWKFVSFKPTSIAANKTGVLAVTSFGTAEADCVAAWAVEA